MTWQEENLIYQQLLEAIDREFRDLAIRQMVNWVVKPKPARVVNLARRKMLQERGRVMREYQRKAYPNDFGPEPDLVVEAEWEVIGERTVQWDKEQTEYLKGRLELHKREKADSAPSSSSSSRSG